MAGQGYRYLQELQPAEVALGAKVTEELNSRLWGISDLSVAREYGYHLPRWTDGTGVPLTIGRMSAPERKAYGWCRTQSEHEIAAHGLDSAGQELVAGLQAQSWNQADASPQLHAVFARWSACMRVHGYGYSNPLQAAAAAKLGNPKTGAPLPVTRGEIKTAVTDIACKQSTNLLAVAYSVQSTIQDRLIKQHRSVLAQVKTQLLKQARELAALAARYQIPTTA
jgi:hypothetical protein